MRPGKLLPAVLRDKVLSYLGSMRPEVLVHASLGEDAAVIDFGDWVCVLSTDPITAASNEAAWLSVHVSCNDIAAMGAEPVGVLLSFIIPERCSTEDIEGLMKDASRAASELGIEILGGHTEITPGIPYPVCTTTAVGKTSKDRLVTSSGARAGESIIMTKEAGIEGTAILARDYRRLLGSLDPQIVERARRFFDRVSAVRDGLIAARVGVSAMHDVTEGGVFAALFELAEASKVGILVEVERIPVAPETRTISHLLGIDPLRLISSGSMLIVTPNPDLVIDELSKNGIRASLIGRTTEHGRYLQYPSGLVELIYPEIDELWKIIERKPMFHQDTSLTDHF